MAMPFTYNNSAFFMDPSEGQSDDGAIEQRHETDGIEQVAGEAVLLTHDEHELLDFAHTHRDHQTPAGAS